MGGADSAEWGRWGYGPGSSASPVADGKLHKVGGLVAPTYLRRLVALGEFRFLSPQRRDRWRKTLENKAFWSIAR
jgi:hypothetical protein